MSFYIRFLYMQLIKDKFWRIKGKKTYMGGLKGKKDILDSLYWVSNGIVDLSEEERKQIEIILEINNI